MGCDFYWTGDLSDANMCCQEGSLLHKWTFHRGEFLFLFIQCCSELLRFELLMRILNISWCARNWFWLVMDLGVGSYNAWSSVFPGPLPSSSSLSLLLLLVWKRGLCVIPSTSCPVKRGKLLTRTVCLPDSFSSSQICLNLKPGCGKYCYLLFSSSEMCLSTLESWETPCALDNWTKEKILGDPDAVNIILFASQWLFHGKWKWASLRFLKKTRADLTEKTMAPHCSTRAWKIPWMEEPGRLQSMGSRRVRHDWTTSLSLFTFIHWRRKWQPTPVFLPGESQRQGSLVGCRLWGHTESDTTDLMQQQQQQQGWPEQRPKCSRYFVIILF